MEKVQSPIKQKKNPEIKKTTEIIAPVMAKGRRFGEAFFETYDFLPEKLREELVELAKADRDGDIIRREDELEAFTRNHKYESGLDKLFFLINTREYFEFSRDLGDVYRYLACKRKTLDKYIDMSEKIIKLCQENNRDRFRLFLCLSAYTAEEPAAKEAFPCFLIMLRCIDNPDATPDGIWMNMFRFTINSRLLLLCHSLIETYFM